MGHFYFVRHGQTVWNVANKICGTTDVELTDLGREQARLSAEAILKDGLQIDEILYSPLIRARDTALIIADITGIPAKEEPMLLEQCFGIYEAGVRDGKEFHEAKKQFAYNYETGESMLKLAQRIYNLIDRIKMEEDKTYLLVAHNGIARVVQSYFESMTNDEYAGFGVANAKIIEYKF